MRQSLFPVEHEKFSDLQSRNVPCSLRWLKISSLWQNPNETEATMKSTVGVAEGLTTRRNEEEGSDREALLEFEPPSGRVFPTLCGGRNGQPSAQRANAALVLAAIKSTRLVAPTTDPKASLPSQCHQYHPNPLPSAIPNQPPYFYTTR